MRRCRLRKNVGDRVENAVLGIALAEVQRQHPSFSDKPKIGTADQIAERLRPYVELGFRHILFDAAAPFDDETLQRFVGEVKPMLEGVASA